ncbi:hypothetical protein BDQ12DRAFT_770143 [Crucibulum laeve]|uniref:SP-RING-type domain-containing protein n=1 Tax=Crucibulum laeve TaxID=68775 RepID=A0A5C3MHH2_9AGAR|nr:hypothetical protein BDQ12DRAFT_770143 [Crucibulum laeve]
MPVASSSRRKANTRRMNSSDIEEDTFTQPQADDDVESDHDRPRQSKRPKKEVKNETKAARKQRAVPTKADANDEEEDSNEDERIDVDDFPDQPLRKDQMTMLNNIAKDWLKMEQTIGQHWGALRDVGSAIAETADGDEENDNLDELEQVARDIIDIGAEMKSHARVLEGLQQKILQGDEVTKAGDVYISGVKESKKEYAKKTTRQKYAKDENYKDFKSAIYEVQHPATAMPPITDFIPKEDGDDSDDDDDLEVGGVTQNYNCPITLTLLVNPLTSSICGHSFSGDAIKHSFPRPGMAIKCPASGCNKSFKLSDCKPDANLEKKVKAFKRRADRAAEDSDAEEVIE